MSRKTNKKDELNYTTVKNLNNGRFIVWTKDVIARAEELKKIIIKAEESDRKINEREFAGSKR